MATIKLKNGSGAPLASDLVQGEPALDLTNKRLYTEDSLGAVIEVGVNPTELNVTNNITVGGTVDGRDIATDGTKLDTVETNADVTDTANVTAAGAVMDSELTNETAVKALDQGVATTDSPTFAGLGTTGDVTFGDNDKAIFGAGSDLQIYHDGSNSYVQDAGTGDLVFKHNGNYARFETGGGTKTLEITNGGSVDLYHNGSAKLATTSTGIDVTGTVTADSLDVNGTATVDGITAGFAADFTFTGPLNSDLIINARGNQTTEGLLIQQNGVSNASFLFGGDISFYNSAGTSQDFYWDASASSLGIGTTSPSATYSVDATKPMRIQTAAPSIELVETDAASQRWSMFGLGGNLTFRDITNNVYAMTLESSTGNVGINNTNPAAPLHSNGATQYGSAAKFQNDGSATSWARVDWINDQVSGSGIVYRDQTGSFVFRNDNSSGSSMNTDIVAGGTTSGVTRFFRNASTESMRIDSSGHAIIPAGVTLGTSAGTYAAANTLDDYEEGTFTPTLSDGTNEGTYVRQIGNYTKVGDLVTATIRVTISAKGSMSGNLQIGGLPYTSKNVANSQYSGTVGYVLGASVTAGYSITSYVGGNSATAFLRLFDSTGGASSLEDTDVTANFDIAVTYTYLAA